MDRKEQLIEAAKCRIYPRLKEEVLNTLEGEIRDLIEITLSIAFVEGAKWADDNPNWISVKDNVPDFYVDDECGEEFHESTKIPFTSTVVLVYSESLKRIELATYEKSYDFKEEKWNEPKFRTLYDGFNVTHWMPLPKKPKN